MKYRIGRKQKRAIINEDGIEVALFSKGQEELAEKVCKKLNEEKSSVMQLEKNKWYTADKYMEKYAAIDATHGICPECRDKVVAEMVEQDDSLDIDVKGRIVSTFRGEDD